MKKYFFFAVLVFCVTASGAQESLKPSKVLCNSAPISIVNCTNFGRMPSFPGGDSVFQEYVRKNLLLKDVNYNQETGRTVMVQFDVDTFGKVCNVRLVNTDGANPAADSAVVHLFCGMPDWIPGGAGKETDTVKINLAVRMVATISFPTHTSKKTTPLTVTFLQWPEGVYHKPPSSEEGVVLTFSEVPPVCPGGYNHYLQENLRYPEAERAAGKEGTVLVRFIIEKDGRISNVEMAKSVKDAPGFDNEALRLISSMPPWTPAYLDHKPIRLETVQQVKFTLQ